MAMDLNDIDRGHYGMINAATNNTGLKKEFDDVISAHRDLCIKSIKAKDMHQAELHSDIGTAFEDFWERLSKMSEAYRSETEANPPDEESGLND